jgi:peroxiredoxin
MRVGGGICIKEIPHLIELYNQFHPQGLEIIAVAMYYDPPSHVVAMTKAKQIPYAVALDLKAEHAQAFGQVQLTPTTFLISSAGIIIKQKTGQFDFTDMKHQLENIFKG